MTPSSPSWTFYSNPICDSVTVLLVLVSEVFEFYICACRCPRLFLQRIGKVGLPPPWQKQVCWQKGEVSSSCSVWGKKSQCSLKQGGWGRGVSGSVGSWWWFGVPLISPHWQPLGQMAGPPKELLTCHPLQQPKGCCCPAVFLKLTRKVGFSVPHSAWLPTQDTAVVVSPTCLLVHFSVSAYAHCWQRQSIQQPSPAFKMFQVNVLPTAVFDPDRGSDFQLVLKMTAGKSLGSGCLKVFRVPWAFGLATLKFWVYIFFSMWDLNPC